MGKRIATGINALAMTQIWWLVQGGRMVSAPTKGNVGAFFERPRANTVRPYEGIRITTGFGSWCAMVGKVGKTGIAIREKVV